MKKGAWPTVPSVSEASCIPPFLGFWRHVPKLARAGFLTLANKTANQFNTAPSINVSLNPSPRQRWSSLGKPRERPAHPQAGLGQSQWAVTGQMSSAPEWQNQVPKPERLPKKQPFPSHGPIPGVHSGQATLSSWTERSQISRQWLVCPG